VTALHKADPPLRASRVAVLIQFAPPLVFIVALPLLWLRFGHWFYLSIDEGIYLEGARRVAAGNVPYRDFFVLTGPGTFWLYGGVFHFFGAALASARFVLCCELASLCAAIAWLASRFAGAAFAIASALLFLMMLLTSLYPLYITHRWDSNTFALLALVFVWSAYVSESATSPHYLIAGVCAGIAAWITPPMLIVASALALWIGLGAKSKPGFWRFAAGICLPSVAAMVVLLHEGAFGIMLRTLGWDASNYAGANRIGYGALAGTFQSFWRPGATLTAIVHFSDSVLPVLLPPLALAGCALAFSRSNPSARKFLGLLTVVSVSSLLACYPRFGAAQLLFGNAFFWALCTCALACLLPRRAHSWLAVGAFLIAGVELFAGWPQEPLKPIETPAGILKVSRRQYVQLNDLLTAIKHDESLFVYPYLPSLYFVLGANNPTRYAWLQPGMMGTSDVQTALTELKMRPPHWIVWHDFTEAFILKNWPSSDRSKLRFPEMEQFFATNYHVSSPDGVVPIGNHLLERNQ
jgi:hypothetical protein